VTWAAATIGSKKFLVYRYVDPSAGPSAKGCQVHGEWPNADEIKRAIEMPDVTLRVAGIQVVTLPPEQVRHWQLPEKPPWMRFFEPVGGPWREDPALRGRFHEELEDDIEVLFVLLAHRTLERMWVRLHGVSDFGYRGRLLNTSHVEGSLESGSEVLVRLHRGAKDGEPALIWVPPVAEENLRSWRSQCRECGFDLVLRSVDELAKQQFPGAPPGAVPEMFTRRCLLCQGTMTVERRR